MITPPEVPEHCCDVLIVGGGPSGLVLAGLLAQRGVEAVVLERRPAASAHSRAIGLHPPAMAALEALQLDSAAVAEGAPIAAGEARSRGRSLGALSFERAWPQRPYVLALPQARTEALLTGRLAELSPGALHRGWEADGLDASGGDVTVLARPADRSGGPVRWRARVVVGADGARSTIRDLAGITTTLSTYPDTSLMGDVADAGGDGRARIHLEPDGVVESFPLPGGRRRWVAHTGNAAHSGNAAHTSAAHTSGTAHTSSAARTSSAGHAGSSASASTPVDLARLVAERTGERIDPASSTMISAFAVRRRTARRMVDGRVVLIGDAAHEISPIGGQGMTLGWLDALALAPLLEDVIAQDLRRPLTQIPAFARFARNQLRIVRRAGLLAHVNMTLGRPLPLPLARTRDTALRAALATPLRHELARAYSMAWA